ncbi:E3 ubiquitin-protein ligase RHF1A [Raphanus sativus]|uniref:RING-type E3 ubiquitin transferase n=1 Tax=Raphanus sativus TaxID=3726 RepID=A0A6J0KUA2_RAPSA|nr:E3 ubiquitin-protein ligase RHF1A [Raphanus sativus]KAJ4880022.1 E3 ubiquitin-protein ligase RHF1A [Raphanus sativus]
MSSFTYASAFNLSEKSPAIASSSSSSAFVDDDTDDACSICLEPFTLQDPATVTSCKHEYHLQCIIEWSQRSKECPICWQFFVLKDPLSQELLAAVDKERLMKTTSNVRSSSSPTIIGHSNEDDFHSEEESSFDEQFLRHLTQAAHRRCTRETPISSNDPTPTDMANLAHIPHVQHQNANPPSPASPAVTSNGSRISPGPSPPSEASSLPEAIKSKLAAASARYKESISKSKQGLKEKLLARNNSVKELSKGVQREMNAGIAGVARMMERLDFASKRFGGSTTSGFNFSFKGKREEEADATSNIGGQNRIP